MSSLGEYVDEAYLCILTVEESGGASIPTGLFSDEEYAVELQMQEAIASSLLVPNVPAIPTVEESGGASIPTGLFSDEEYAVELQMKESIASSLLVPNVPAIPPPAPAPAPGPVAAGCSSSSAADAASGPSELLCSICMESKEPTEAFQSGACAHRFCRDCICNYIAVRLKEEGSTIRCPEPGCVSIIDAYRCRGIVPEAVFERWSAVLAESLVHPDNLLYCSYRDCSGPMEREVGTVVSMAECPYCRRLLCALCGVAWHAGLSCGEYQHLRTEEGRGDTLFLKMAEERLWKKCPGCKLYVEKVSGCLHMTCRCKVEFCYQCGALWDQSHNC